MRKSVSEGSLMGRGGMPSIQTRLCLAVLRSPCSYVAIWSHGTPFSAPLTCVSRESLQDVSSRVRSKEASHGLHGLSSNR